MAKAKEAPQQRPQGARQTGLARCALFWPSMWCGNQLRLEQFHHTLTWRRR